MDISRCTAPGAAAFLRGLRKSYPLSLATLDSSRQRERKVVARMTGVEPYLDNDAKALNINVFHSSELYP